MLISSVFCAAAIGILEMLCVLAQSNDPANNEGSDFLRKRQTTRTAIIARKATRRLTARDSTVSCVPMSQPFTLQAITGSTPNYLAGGASDTYGQYLNVNQPLTAAYQFVLYNCGTNTGHVGSVTNVAQGSGPQDTLLGGIDTSSNPIARMATAAQRAARASTVYNWVCAIATDQTFTCTDNGLPVKFSTTPIGTETILYGNQYASGDGLRLVAQPVV